MKIGACSVCGKSVELRAGMCVSDYTSAWRKRMEKIKCKVEGCSRGVKSRMMCDTHYRAVRRREKLKEEIALKAQAQEELEKIENLKRTERSRVLQLPLIHEAFGGKHHPDCITCHNIKLIGALDAPLKETRRG